MIRLAWIPLRLLPPIAFAALIVATSAHPTCGQTAPLSLGPFFDVSTASALPSIMPPAELPQLVRKHTLLPWHLVMPPPEPLRYADESYFGYTTGRILPRDFLDSRGQPKR